MKPSCLIFLLLLGTSACLTATPDPHSYANHEKILVEHISLNLTANFEKKILSGNATLDLKTLQPATVLQLDTRDLKIISVDGNCSQGWSRLNHKLATKDAILGSKLQILFGKNKHCNQVRIEYQTSPEASGLQWLDKNLTAAKKYPFMFSQSETLHGRSWIPMQDTPAIRVTYDATIHAPKSLRVLMSANNDPEAKLSGSFKFEMNQAISPYLIAIAIGDVSYHRWTERTGVWAEPPVLAAAAEEFKDTEKMITITEKMYGEYPFEQYDLLILPPSFPFGGMENPRLSFITPTVIVGDKSLTSMISHELAHSWSGNLVTNASWGDLWLNEGITSYLENRIIEKIFDRSVAEMEAVIAYQSLQKDLQVLPLSEQSLYQGDKLDDPDDAFTDIPYIKGQLFMFYLEKNFGRDNLDVFLKDYFDEFKFKTISTDQFIQCLTTNLLEKYPDNPVKDANIQQWIFAPGLPDDAFIPSSGRLQKIDKAVVLWQQTPSQTQKLNASNWSTQEWVYFLNNLPKKISLANISQLDKAFSLSQTANAEISLAWFPIIIRNDYRPSFSFLQQYLLKIGRIRLIYPLYELLEKNHQQRIWSLQVYQMAKSGYHPLTVKLLDDLFYKNL